MKNEKVHSILLTLVGGYMLYLAYQLFEKYRTGTKEMPDAAFIVSIAVFGAAGISILMFAWRVYRKQKSRKGKQNAEGENTRPDEPGE